MAYRNEITPNTLPEKWSIPLDLGFSVIPVEPRGKEPMGKWKPYMTRAAARAIVAHWAANNNCNVGIVTGRVSGLIILDFDDQRAEAEAQRRGLPDTVTVKTSRGRHYYFAYTDRPVRKPRDFPPGMDIQSDNKFVVAPGSIHPNGSIYEWENDPLVYPIADLPEWLIGRPKDERQDARGDGNEDDGPIITPAIMADLTSALQHISAVAHDDWIAVGQALASLPNDKGKQLWLNWSATCPEKFDRAVCESRWPTFTADHTSYRAIFAKAQANGWTNPAKTKKADMTFHGVVPVDLWTGYAAPPLPYGLLPPVIENFARKHGAIMGIDPSGLAMAALAVASAAITDETVVQVKRHDPTWRESARLWVGLVGAPSTKKSPIIREASRPLSRIDAEMARKYAIEVAAYERLSAEEKRATERPRQERRVISDATFEATQEVMKDSPWGLLSLQDELSGWFGAMDKYSPGKGAQADRAFWLQAFNGGPYSVNRVSRGAVHIGNCSVSLLGGIQPEPLRKLAKDTVDDGLIQRLIPVVLRPGDVGEDKPTGMVVAEYAELIGSLVRKPGMVLQFDDTALAIRERLEAEHFAAVQALETMSPKLAAHLGKYDGLFARLCVLWHVVEYADTTLPAVIDGDVSERVADFMDQFIQPSAVAFYAGQLGLSDDYNDLLALASFIVADQLDLVDARTAQRSGGSPLRSITADEVRRLCEKLSAYGWLEPIDPKGLGRPAQWTVNPAVHTAFAEYADRERDRRVLARDAIKNAFNR